MDFAIPRRGGKGSGGTPCSGPGSPARAEPCFSIALAICAIGSICTSWPAASTRRPSILDPETWECPEFFALAGRHVLIYSAGGKAQWQAGRLDTGTMMFHPDQAGILDYGSYYAPKTQLDKNGNRILWGWIPEARSTQEAKAAGWAGMMSLPRVLSVAADGRVRFEVLTK